MGYTSGYKYWNLEKRQFDSYHNVVFKETEFPTSADFDDAPAATPVPPTLPTQPASAPHASLHQRAQNSNPYATAPDPIIHDTIVVQRPPGHIDVVRQLCPPPHGEPVSYSNAKSRPDAQNWINAMLEELRSLHEKNTWMLVRLPPGRKVIGTKWVYRLKMTADGQLEKYKARLVAKGYSQIAGIDFDETWAPVVHIESVRTLFTLAAFYGFYILHIDAKTAFLNAHSVVELYILQPEGFIDPQPPDIVLLLNKSLYGLKQAPRIWYLLLSDIICSFGFVACISDPSIYIHATRNIILAVYVDDILVFAQDQATCMSFYHEISQIFAMEDKGAVKSFLGINVTRTESSISIDQAAYIERMLKHFEIQDALPAKTPLESSLPL